MALPLFSLQPGKLNKGPGTYKAENVVHCTADGEITLSWTDKKFPDENVLVLEGEDYATYEADTITIVSGTFHLSNQ